MTRSLSTQMTEISNPTMNLFAINRKQNYDILVRVLKVQSRRL